MSIGLLKCPKCKTFVNAEHFAVDAITPCVNCGAELEVNQFPALFRATGKANAGERVMTEGEASCFYHPEKKAVIPCEACGRFLCALCDVELNGQHLCTGCLESGAKKGKLTSLENQRTLYDSAALTLALLPCTVFLWWAAPVTAPAAIICAVWYWKKPSSIIPRTRIRSILAIVLGTLQIIGLGLLLYRAMNE